MRQFTESDKKEIQNIFLMLNKAHFKEITMQEIVAIVGIRKWLADLFDEIEKDLKEKIEPVLAVADATPVSEPIKTMRKRKK